MGFTSVWKSRAKASARPDKLYLLIEEQTKQVRSKLTRTATCIRSSQPIMYLLRVRKQQRAGAGEGNPGQIPGTTPQSTAQNPNSRADAVNNGDSE